jgi:hypothetical protein
MPFPNAVCPQEPAAVIPPISAVHSLPPSPVLGAAAFRYLLSASLKRNGMETHTETGPLFI